MRKNIGVAESTRLINCGMLVLVTAKHEGASTITPCAWHMPVAKIPTTIGIALATKHFSSELIKGSKEFVVNIPNWSLLDKVISCGKISGRNTDKFKEFKFTEDRAKCPSINTPKVAECIGFLECLLIGIEKIGDHFLFLGEVMAAEVEEEYFNDGIWDEKKSELIFHLGGKSFFRLPPVR